VRLIRYVSHTQLESINNLLTRRYLIRTTAALLINAPRTRLLPK